jgi:hypothetical protein
MVTTASLKYPIAAVGDGVGSKAKAVAVIVVAEAHEVKVGAVAVVVEAGETTAAAIVVTSAAIDRVTRSRSSPSPYGVRTPALVISREDDDCGSYVKCPTAI